VSDPGCGACAGPAVVAPTDEGTWVTNFEDGTVWFVALAD
jgi:hypothetical protein